jgi:hypothetical protein
MSTIRLAGALLVAAAAALVLAGSAVGAPTAPTGLTSTPASPTNAAPSVSWTGSTTADVGFTIVRYDWSVTGATTLSGTVPAAGPLTTGPLALAPGVSNIVVTAVQQGPAAPLDESGTPSAPLGILIDQTPPTISVLTSGPLQAGWYRSVTRDWTCDDPAGPGGASGLSALTPCPADQTITASGNHPAVGPVTVNDNAGNSSAAATAPAVNVDSLSPAGFALSSPTNDAIVAAAPTFVWTESVDAHSGTVRYEVVAHYNGADRIIAVTPGLKNVVATFGTGGVSPPALPLNEEITWFVRAFDAAGNAATLTGQRAFVIDPNAPPPATITDGPGAFTNDTTPSFSWSGPAPSFEWAVIPAGADNPVQQGSGASTQTTLGGLGEGSYTFRVVQVSAAGVKSQEATYSFTVDTTPPAGPVITVRPISPTKIIQPTFGWNGEAHATYTLRIIGAGGGVAQSASTKATTHTLAPLTPGPYTLEITQTDRAGNTSGVTRDPFSILGPSGLQAGTKLSLPTTNHRRLKPRKGLVVPTRRPVLRWTPGPRSTTLYNVQLFRVMKRSNGKARVVKVFSTFPRALQYRVPAKRTRPSTCYVWRVWPYLGTKFTPKPLGISNFCIASKKVLLKAAQRKAARARAARAARR